MKLEEIKHPELKNHINMMYMHGENNNQAAIEKTEAIIKEYIQDKEFIISVEDNEPVKIPYGNDGQYIVPIFTDALEYKNGMQYFSLNVMDENKDLLEKWLTFWLDGQLYGSSIIHVEQIVSMVPITEVPEYPLCPGRNRKCNPPVAADSQL